MTIAAEHAAEAADTLRAAIQIADPYRRDDAISEALERVKATGAHSDSRTWFEFQRVARRLCLHLDGATQLDRDGLEDCARQLDAIWST